MNDRIDRCPFCSVGIRENPAAARGSVFAVYDRFPVTEGHLLFIPKRHTADWFSMTAEERGDVLALLDEMRDELLANDPSITGFNVGVNCGESAGQTVPHAHLHLIPRRDGDCEDPTGGVRGVIEEKRIY